MATLNIKSLHGEEETLKELIFEGIKEEKRKVGYALGITTEIIRTKEDYYKISSAEFLEMFKRGDIEENDDTFQWWAELKLADILQKKNETLSHIEICQK